MPLPFFSSTLWKRLTFRWLNRKLKMSDIWAGTAGPIHWLCLYHMTLWRNEQEYANHMAVHHNGLNESRPLRIVSVDKENGVITLQAEKI